MQYSRGNCCLWVYERQSSINPAAAKWRYIFPRLAVHNTQTKLLTGREAVPKQQSASNAAEKKDPTMRARFARAIGKHGLTFRRSAVVIVM